jgi:hypothetical protein
MPKKKRMPKSVFIGSYNEYGYAVVNHTTSTVVYTAGNSLYDSQTYLEPSDERAVSLALMREFCQETTRDIARENKAEYGGVGYDDSGNPPG